MKEKYNAQVIFRVDKEFKKKMFEKSKEEGFADLSTYLRRLFINDLKKGDE